MPEGLEVAVLTTRLTADNSGFKRGVNDANRQGAAFERNSKRHFAGAAGAMKSAGKVGALAIGVGLFTGLKKANDEAREAQLAGRQMDAALKSTGRAAGHTRRELEAMAEALSQKTAIDDEAIMSTQNLLLTFTKIGKSGGVFKQTTALTLDLAQALGTDARSAAIQLGKAVNDPIKGVTALGRAGVQFTQKQKDTIKVLVESGQLLKAQKIILKEVATQVEGSAESAATPLKLLGVTFANIAEDIGGKFVPWIDKGAQGINRFIEQMRDGKGVGGGFRKAIEGIAGAAKRTGQNVLGIKPPKLGPPAPPLIGPEVPDPTRTERALERIKTAWTDAKEWIVDAIAVIRKELDLSDEDMRKLGEAMKNVFAAVETAITATVAVYRFMVERVMLPITARALPGIQAIFQGTFRTIGGIVKLFTGILTLDFGQAMEGLKQIASGNLKALGGVIRTATAPVREAAAQVAGSIADAFTAAKDAVASAARSVIRKARDEIAAKWSLFWDLAKFLIGKLRDGMLAAIGASLGGLGKAIMQKLKSGLGTLTIPLKFALPSLSGAFGGPEMPSGGGGGGLSGVTKIAAGYGNVVTSGYRPGDPGWHGKDRARDYAGGNMLGFARAMAGMGGKLLELIHTPLGFGIKNGKRVDLGYWGAAVNSDHWDHVHVAMRRGGKAGPNTGPEVVYGEGRKTEWWVSQEGNRQMNRRWAAEAVSALGGVASFKKGAKKKKPTRAERFDKATGRVELRNLGTDIGTVGKADLEQLRADVVKAQRLFNIARKYGTRSDKLRAKLDLLQAKQRVSEALASTSATDAGAGADAGPTAAPAAEPAVSAEDLQKSLDALTTEMTKQRELSERTHNINVSEVNRMFMDWISGQLGGRGAASLRTLSKGAAYA